MNITKVISTTIERGRRIVKILRYGKSDIQTSYETAPFGVDSSPIKNMRAIYSPTAERGKSVIVGYINENQIAENGEVRLYSTNSIGISQTYLWLKSNGNIEIGGNTKNAISFTELQLVLTNYNTNLMFELTKIQSAIAAVGGAYTPSQSLIIDISAAKVNNVKF